MYGLSNTFKFLNNLATNDHIHLLVYFPSKFACKV